MAHVLIADEHSAIRTLLGVLLETDGHDVAAASNGREVLEYLQHTTPALLILQGALPLLSGYELCSRVKRLRRLRESPVVLMLESGDERARIEASLVSADAVLSKPISAQALREVLRTLALTSA